MANWRYDVTLGPEYIALILTGTVNIVHLIHYRTVIDAVAHVKYKYLYDTYSSSPFTPTFHDIPPQTQDFRTTANDATLSQDEWPDPNDSATLSTSQLPSELYYDKDSNPFQQWFVRLRYNDGRFLDLPMGKIANQEWTNDQSGAAVCVGDILTLCITP